MSTVREESFNPTTQGRVHPLQWSDENFLGYFTREFFKRGIAYRSKRMAEEDPHNPYRDLHESLRPFPVFVAHNEALEKHYELYVTGRASPEEARKVREKFLEEKHRATERAEQEDRSGFSFGVYILLASLLVVAITLEIGNPELIKFGGLAFLASIIFLIWRSIAGRGYRNKRSVN